MSIRAQIVALKNLAALDAELAELGGTLQAEQGSLTGKKSRLADFDAKLAAVDAGIAAMDKTRSGLTAEQRQMVSQIEHAREKLARSRNEREINAAQRELEELRKLQRDREHELEKLSGLADQARGEATELGVRRAELVAELGESEGETSQRIVELQQGEVGKQAQRDALIAQIDSMTFRRYEMVRKQRGSGLARAVNGSCSACHIALPPMMFQQIMQQQPLQQCPMCRRVLYFEEPTVDGSSGEASA